MRGGSGGGAQIAPHAAAVIVSGASAAPHLCPVTHPMSALQKKRSGRTGGAWPWLLPLLPAAAAPAGLSVSGYAAADGRVSNVSAPKRQRGDGSAANIGETWTAQQSHVRYIA